MPMTPGCQRPSWARTRGADRRLAVGCRLDLLDGLLQHRRLDLLALAVERVQADGDRRRLVLVLGGQQARTQAGLADPAAGVDARPEDEAQVIDPRRLLQPGHVAERPEPHVAALLHHRKPLAHEGAIDAGERHHVADGAERHQVEPLQEVGLRPLAIPARLAQAPVEPDDEEEGHAHGGELAVRAVVVQPVGVDHGARLRQPRLAQVVVDHDHVEPGLGGVVERVEGADPAIDGDHDGHVLRREDAHGGAVRAVALAQAVGDVDRGRLGDGLEEAAEQRGRGGAVDIVVAEDGDRLSRLDRAGEPRDGRLHVAQVERVGQQAAERGVEVVGRLLGRDAAGREHAPDQLRHLDGLGQREAVLGIDEPRPPALAEQRSLDPEHRSVVVEEGSTPITSCVDSRCAVGAHHSPIRSGVREKSCSASIMRTVPVRERMTTELVRAP